MIRSRLVWVLGLSSIDFVFQQTISPALPDIQARFHASPTAVTWVITGFLLTAAPAIALAGPFGDRYGRRRVLVWCVALFGAGSAVCALSQSIWVMIAGRLIQGLGAGVSSLAIAIIRDRVPKESLPAAIGFLIGASGVGGVIGTIATGVLVTHVSIAAVFWCLCVLSVLLITAALAWVEESPIYSRASIDWIGSLLLGGALAALMLGTSEANSWHWDSSRVLGLFALSLVLAAVFVARLRTARAPLMQLRVLIRRPIWTANAAGVTIGLAFFNGITLVALIAGYPKATGYGLGLTSTQIAYVLAPEAAATVAGALLAGRLVKLIGARQQAIVGGLVAVCSCLALTLVPRTAPALAAALAPLGAAIALSASAVIDLVAMASSRSEAGGAAAVNTVGRTIGQALGPQVAIAVVIATPALRSGFPAAAGFDDAFVLDLIISVIAVATMLIIPPRGSDPVLRAA